MSWDPRADLAPHVATTADAVDYEATRECVLKVHVLSRMLGTRAGGGDKAICTFATIARKVVIPTYGRWKPSQELAPNRARLKDWKEAFILDHTLRFLARPRVQ